MIKAFMTVNSRLLLRRRKGLDEIRELHRRRARGLADVVAARAHAGAQAFAQIKSERLTKAEAGVEVVAGAGADLRLLHERPVKARASVRRRRRGASPRV